MVHYFYKKKFELAKSIFLDLCDLKYFFILFENKSLFNMPWGHIYGFVFFWTWSEILKLN